MSSDSSDDDSDDDYSSDSEEDDSPVNNRTNNKGLTVKIIMTFDYYCGFFFRMKLWCQGHLMQC